MTVLWLLRHGEAARPAGVPDFDRPLTERGEAQAADAGRALAEHSPALSVAFTSPRVRARDTARIACANHGGGDEPVLIDELGDQYNAQELLALISPWNPLEGPDAQMAGILVVGHNPELMNVASELVGESVGMPTGALVAIDLRTRTLLHSIVPDH